MDIGSGDIMREILKRLPVKSLLRFMCVSELWRDLIRDPSFAAFHVRFNKRSSSELAAVLGCSHKHEEDHSEGFKYIPLTKTNETTPELLRIRFPWKQKLSPKPEPPKESQRVKILGHCNGLVLARDNQTYHVLDVDNPWNLRFLKMEWLIICNNITRRFQILPESDIEIPPLQVDSLHREKLAAFGFGVVDDVAYKVVRVTYGIGRVQDTGSIWIHDYEPYRTPWVEVYDSRSGSWLSVTSDQDLSYEYSNDCGVYNSYDKCLYWLERGHGKIRNRYTTLVSFDLVKEEWRETLLPYRSNFLDDYEPRNEEYVFGQHGYCQSVGVLGESVVLFDGDQRNKLVRSVWKMNREDNHKVSWTHMYRFNFNGSPKGFCRDGKLLLTTQRRGPIVLHDPEKMDDGACFGFTNLGFKMVNVVSDFVESLPLLDGESEVIGDGEETFYFPQEPEKPRKRVWEEEDDIGDLSTMFHENL